MLTRDFDIGVVGLSGGGASPDMYDIYGEDGSLNIFGMDTEMPYGNDSENMMIEGVTITDLEQRDISVPLFGILAAIGAAAFIALYKRKK